MLDQERPIMVRHADGTETPWAPPGELALREENAALRRRLAEIDRLARRHLAEDNWSFGLERIIRVCEEASRT